LAFLALPPCFPSPRPIVCIWPIFILYYPPFARATPVRLPSLLPPSHPRPLSSTPRSSHSTAPSLRPPCHIFPPPIPTHTLSVSRLAWASSSPCLLFFLSSFPTNHSALPSSLL
jgi:hypothetical protein